MACSSRECPLPLPKMRTAVEPRPQSRVPVTALVVEGQPLARKSTVDALAGMAEVCRVFAAGSGNQALSIASQHLPGVVVLGDCLLGTSGAHLIPALRANVPSSSVLMLTSHECDWFVRQAVEAGVQGFLCKSCCSTVDLATAVRACLVGEKWLCRRASAALVGTFGSASRRGRDLLTPRERQVWMHVAKGSSNAAIARELGISTSSVKGHVSSLLRKLGVNSRLQAALLAARHSTSEDTKRM